MKKKYSLACLVFRQPKLIRRHKEYPELLARLNSSSRLQKLKINRRCYSLLDRAVIKPEHLGNFYSTYRLPEDPFFPLFFKIKCEYLFRRKQLKIERQKYIRRIMSDLDEKIRDTIIRLEQYEQKLHRSGRQPVWKVWFMPQTKKRADALKKMDHQNWIEYFSGFLKDCSRIYPGSRKISPDRIIASFVLELDEDTNDMKEINRQYRLLSLEAHPDQGGTEEAFRLISWAKDVLSGN